MFERLLPRRADNEYSGLRPALWLLGLFGALKLVMGLNSIFNTKSVATGADGIRLEGLDPASAWMIGDNPVADVGGATAAGMRATLVRHADAHGRTVTDAVDSILSA